MVTNVHRQSEEISTRLDTRVAQVSDVVNALSYLFILFAFLDVLVGGPNPVTAEMVVGGVAVFVFTRWLCSAIVLYIMHTEGVYDGLIVRTFLLLTVAPTVLIGVVSGAFVRFAAPGSLLGLVAGAFLFVLLAGYAVAYSLEVNEQNLLRCVGTF